MKLPVRQLGGDERGQALLRCPEAFPADWSTHRVLVLYRDRDLFDQQNRRQSSTKSRGILNIPFAKT
ncbi:hypothetical protein CSC33_4837 [Pseudomonas aeruginosa]|nr:hypothetical protein CSC33_4837 [Pseudomonas aeruginosa]